MCCTSNPRAFFTAPSRLLSRCFLTVLACAAFASAQAQPAATGTIRGKVQNATNGASLENVVISVAGTPEQVRSDGYGDYVLRNVPAGEVTLRASYIGEPEQTATVTVAAGVEAKHDFLFRATETTKRLDDGTVVLDRFVVSTERYKNARAVAIAEERNSVNIKNVVSIGEFGEIPSGNVGEFVKFLPGVQVDYGASNGNSQGYSEGTANGVSVRGFGPEDTTILIDGLPVSATLPGNLTRQVGLDQLSINNAARVELIKVNTPDMPSTSVGGQINLVTKSAFEYAKPVYEASAFINVNSQYFAFGKTPGPVNKKTYKTSPGISLSASYPYSKTLGFTVSATLQEEFSQSYRAQPVWNNTWNASFNPSAFTNLAGQPTSIANPVLTRYQVTDSPAITDRNSANFKVDWKPSANQTLRTNIQYSTYTTSEAQRRLDFRPTIATGADWGPDRVLGTTANSTTAMTITTRDRLGNTMSGQFQYALDWKGWRVTAAGSISKSTSDFEDEKNGHYSGLDLNLNPGKVNLFLNEDGIPYRAETFTRSTILPLDYTQLPYWSVANAIATSGQSHNERTIGLLKVDVSRPLDFLPFLRSNPIMLQFGVRRDEDDNFKSGRGTGFKQILRPGASFTVADVYDDTYKFRTPGFGLANQQWASTYKLYDLNKTANLFYVPDFDESTGTRVANYNSYVNQNKDLKETTDGAYVMLSGSYFSNRLTLLAGARQERKARVGKTPYTDSKWNFVKNTDGSVYVDAAHPGGVVTNSATSDLFAATAAGTALRAALTGAGIPFVTVPYGLVGTDLAAAMLNKQPLHEVNQHVTGDPSYSFNAAYQLTKKIDLKAAWSRSFKQQALENGSIGVISGNNLAITEYTPSEQLNQNGAFGQIVVANPGLKPETSRNWDFEVAYYTDTGGKFTVAYYTKSVTNQTMNFTTYSGSTEFDQALTALGLLPSDYDNWRIVTSANSATVQKTSGWEFEVRQDFGVFGKWGRRFSGFVSYAMTDFPPPSAPVPYVITNPDGTTTSLTPTVVTTVLRSDRFGGGGLQFSGNKFSVQVRGTYRNANQKPNTAAITLTDGSTLRIMQPSETRIDVTMGYELTKTYGLFLSGRDVLNGERDEVWLHSGGGLASYAFLNDRKRVGTTWTFGVKGKW